MTSGADLPSGTVTFLFTDLEGSTQLWEIHPDVMGGALARHDAILRTAVADRQGMVVKTTGDGVHAVFTSARDAIECALAAQHALLAQDWGDTGPLRVRMGCNTGEAEQREGDYYGPSVNRAARIMAAAHGGQILVSQTTAQLLEDAMPEGASLVDLGEHRLRDLARPEHVFQIQHPDLPSDFPQLRTLDAYPTNLPAQRTSFVGREDDVDAVADALREHRVVTITGVGGVGKSRLAVQVAATLLPRFPDGAWLCELGAVQDESAVLDAVADAVGVPAGSGPSREAIPWHLRERRAMLVFDDCEHVLEAVTDLVDTLLARCPQISVLATSREALRLPGEQVYSLGTLTPPVGNDVVAVESSPAGRLFVERAREARHDFVLDDGNAAAIAALCVRLDGIPLAIELAAARVRSMSPAQVVDRLDERFRLLTGGTKARGRHQTLRAALAWSTDLLDDDERADFARLSVFVVPFDLPAAEAVIGDAAWERLDALVDKSLLLAEESGGEMRYRMLETVREFASELLVGQGDVAETRTRHAHYFAALGEAVGAGGSFEQAAAVRRDIRNVGAALGWLSAEGDAGRALALTTAFESVYLYGDMGELFGRVGVGVGRLIDAALAVPGALEHPLAPRMIASAASRALADGKSHADAYERARQSVALAEELGVEIPASQHLNVASVSMRSGHLDEARTHALAAIEAADGDALLETRGYVLLAATERWRGDAVAARIAVDASARSAERAGAPFDLAYARLMQGFVYALTDLAEALPMSEEAGRLALESGAATYIAGYALANSGLVRAQLGDFAGAADDLERAVSLSATKGSREELATALAMTGIALLRAGQPRDTAMVFAAASHVFELEYLVQGLGLDTQRLRARLARELGADALADVWARGSSMSDREVRDYVLGALAEMATLSPTDGAEGAVDAQGAVDADA